MNNRTQIAPTRGTYEFVFDIFGRRVSCWSAASHTLAIANVYSDTSPVAFRNAGSTSFEHLNWVGTERVRTSYSGSETSAFSSLPWGDGLSPNGDNGDQYDFAGLDRDPEDNSEHAQFRQYAVNQGRWLMIDPYYGSYDFNNPQSFNRYSYALNNPVSFTDTSGLICTQNPDGSLSCDDPQPGCDANPGLPGCGQPPTGCVFIFNAQGDFEGTQCYDTSGASSPGQPYPPMQTSGGGGVVVAPNKPQPPQTPKKPCPPSSRIAGTLKALNGIGDGGTFFTLAGIHFAAASLHRCHLPDTRTGGTGGMRSRCFRRRLTGSWRYRAS
jgi:RHS repeat-associated protein